MDDEGDDVVDYDWIDGLDLDVDSASLLLPIESSLDNNASGVGAEKHDDDDDAFHTAAEDDADDVAEENDAEEDAATGSSSRAVTFHLTGGSPAHYSDDVNDGDGRPSSDYDLGLMTQPEEEEGGGGDGDDSSSDGCEKDDGEMPPSTPSGSVVNSPSGSTYPSRMATSRQVKQSPSAPPTHGAADYDEVEPLRSPSPLTKTTHQQSPSSPLDYAKFDEVEPLQSPSPLTAMTPQQSPLLPPPTTDCPKDCDEMEPPRTTSPLTTMTPRQTQPSSPPPPTNHAKDYDEIEPLRSPSPPTAMMSQQMQPPPPPPTGITNGYDEVEHIGTSNVDSTGDDHPPVSSNLDAKYDAVDVGESSINFDGDERNAESFDFITDTPPVVDDGSGTRLLVHKMEMKKRAIYRSLLHLSDNSYSFVYGETSENSRDSKVMNDDDEPGLPYIGPDLKEQYELLRTLLRKGLLGSTDDDVEDYCNEGRDDDDMTTKTTNGKAAEESREKDNGQPSLSIHVNPFIPRIKSNVSAILMGPRGHGKSLVLERCLASLSRLAGKRKECVMERMTQEQQSDQAEDIFGQASFRVVRLNGLLFQGDSAVACTQEIARQIGVMSREERRRSRKIIKRKRSHTQSVADLKTPNSSKRLSRKEKSAANTSGRIKLLRINSPATPLLSDDLTQTPTDDYESHDLRIRRSGFNTYIALLDEVLRTARIDGIPILIVLEELDTFLAGGRLSKVESSEGGNLQQDGGSSDRQLLLYHLLDRVADHKFLVSFVGMTTDLTAVSKLEKRVQSRAEGSSKIIYFGHNNEYDDLVRSLLGKFYTPPGSGNSAGDEYNEHMAMLDIREEVEAILFGSKSDVNRNGPEEDGQDTNDFAIVRRVLHRNYNLIGSDMRWVCRVFDVALALFATDIDECIYQCMDAKNNEGCDCIPRLTPSHIAQALVAMSASLDDISSTLDRSGIPTQSTMELIRWGQLIRDPNHYTCLLGTNTRLITLLDLSGPQIAVLLAARRIEARDDARANAEDEIENSRRKGTTGGGSSTPMPLPLTYQRIQDEYTTSFVASGRYTISSDRYPQNVLYRSFMDLMEVDIIRFKREICVGGALQYAHNDMLSSGANISNLPLHINLDWELEFMGAIKTGLLNCSTALREWGMKMN
jgi:hypothetical protein